MEAESGVRARSEIRWSPRPRVRLLARTWLQVMFGDHTPAATSGFHAAVVSPLVMGTTKTITVSADMNAMGVWCVRAC